MSFFYQAVDGPVRGKASEPVIRGKDIRGILKVWCKKTEKSRNHFKSLKKKSL